MGGKVRPPPVLFRTGRGPFLMTAILSGMRTVDPHAKRVTRESKDPARLPTSGVPAQMHTGARAVGDG